MNIEKSTVTKLRITDVKNLDPVTVICEDTGPNAGKIIIECFGDAWSGYWMGMGERNIKEFFSRSPEDYLATKISNLPSSIYDPEAISADAKKRILAERRAREINDGEAREMWADINGGQVEDDPATQPNLMQEIYGDEWWYQLPMKPNPKYEYLCRIITAVQEALKSEIAVAA
jgi:hypothetical protein